MSLAVERKKRVLIPSDERDFVSQWVVAYRDADCDVVTGAFNFDLRSAEFDIVHYQWPEELSGWRPPNTARLQQIRDNVKWWELQCRTIVTVNNLYPHGFEDNSAYKELYGLFYQHCDCVLHFSQVSKNLVCKEFPTAKHCRHIVTTPFNYDELLKKQKARGSRRVEFGIAADDFVVLVIGALRSWEEIQLVSRAFAMCDIGKKRLLMAGRYHEDCGLIQRKWRQFRWRLWLWRRNAVVEEGFVPEEELFRFLDTADVIVVPRLRDLSSGIPALAMTFGRMVVAPSHGAFPEYLAGTQNLLYESGSPASLAKAIEYAANLDRKEVGVANRLRANEWSWNKIITDCLVATESKRVNVDN